MLPNVHLVYDQANSWVTWLLTKELKLTPTKLTINNMRTPRNPKEVQKLTGMAATLNRFISRSADRCRPFFLLINKWKNFEWTEECVEAFQQLKDYLARPPIMSSLEQMKSFSPILL